MTPDEFYEKFELFADAPDAVVKMRELILEMAVRGRLSEQKVEDQKDPAWQEFISEFDDRIYDYDPGPPPPFEIPDAWRWICLEEAVDPKASKKIPSDKIPDDAWLLDLADIDGIRGKVIHREQFLNRKSKSTKAHFEAGDVLYGKLRPYLNKVVVADTSGY